jgi:hypothetical protein
MTSDTRTDMEKMARWSILYVMEHTFLVSYDEICDNLVQVIKKEKKGRKNIKKNNLSMNMKTKQTRYQIYMNVNKHKSFN